MTAISCEFLNLIEKNVRFDYHTGASTWVTYPHSTGWRLMPSMVVSQIDFAGIVEWPERKPLRVKPGETSCLVPGVRHRASVAGRRAGFSHWCHFNCEVLQGVSLFYLVQPPTRIGRKRSVRIGEINQNLAAIHLAEPSLTRMVQRQALGWELITILLERAAFTAERLDLVRNASRLTPVLAYIEENLARPITHELLAKTAGLSPSRFHVLFRSALGSAPYQYVQQLRLKKAQELLMRTDRSIAEIGQEVGHPDPYHFSRVFRTKIGVSPAGFRKRAASRLL